jgi:serine/threonine protein kinase
LKAQVDLALKIYDDVEDMESFRKGFELVYRLTHSNIFTPLAYDVHEGVPFLVMTYCPNGSASSKIGKMSEDDVWRFAHDVASGLAYLHSNKKKIVHQDIKPANVLIDDDGKYMITDFDISTRQKETKRMTRRQVEAMQDTNYGCGTPEYMGPERWPDSETGYKPSSKPMQASDIWSLGATLFELMTGEVPFGETGGAYQRNLCRKLKGCKRKKGAVPKIAGPYSKELKKLVSMCLSVDACNRPWAELIAESTLKHKAPSLPSHTPKWVKVAIVTGTVLIISTIFFIFGSWPPPPPLCCENDSIYTVKVEQAVGLVRTQAGLIDDVKKEGFATGHVEKLIEAAILFQQTDSLDCVSDSVRISGKRKWQMAQELIDIEYSHLKTWENDYRDMEFYPEADSMALRAKELSRYTSNGKISNQY